MDTTQLIQALTAVNLGSKEGASMNADDLVHELSILKQDNPALYIQALTVLTESIKISKKLKSDFTSKDQKS